MPVGKDGVIRAHNAAIDRKNVTPEFRAVIDFFHAFPITRKQSALPDPDFFVTLLALRGFKIAPITEAERKVMRDASRKTQDPHPSPVLDGEGATSDLDPVAEAGASTNPQDLPARSEAGL